MRVLITGGAGFIGTHTTRALRQSGHEVRILDCLDPQIHGLNASFSPELEAIADCFKGDVGNQSDCRNALEGIDAVFHLAARTGVGQSMYDISNYVETNVLGTARLLEAIVKSKINLERFVLSSSRAVYGEGLYQCRSHGRIHPGLRNPQALNQGDFQMRCPHCNEAMIAVPTPTNCSQNPISVYAQTKKQQEDYCLYAANTFELPLTILRYFNVYGSGQSLKNPYTGVVSIFYSLLKNGKSLSLYENGLPIRDFVHVSDVVQANLLSLSQDSSINSVFNVGSGECVTISDIAHAQASAMKVSAILENRGEYRVGDVFGCYADISESKQHLGFNPAVSLTTGMAEFVAWANTQDAVNQYEKTVSELKSHGLFGKVNT